MGYTKTGQVENIKNGMDLVYYAKGHLWQIKIVVKFRFLAQDKFQCA